jgi:hypothetical protein
MKRKELQRRKRKKAEDVRAAEDEPKERRNCREGRKKEDQHRTGLRKRKNRNEGLGKKDTGQRRMRKERKRGEKKWK